MDKQEHDQQTSLTRGTQDDQPPFARLSSQPSLSQDEQAKTTTSKRSFGQLLKGIRPLDISGETEVIEEGLLNDDVDEQPVITDLGPVRRRPSLPVLTNLTRAQRLLTAAIASTIVLSLLAAGLIVLPRLTTNLAQSGPIVLLQAPNPGNLSLPAWGGKSAPNISFITCVSSRPASSTVPQTPCTPLPVSQWQTALNSYLSFVDDRGNLYTWTRGMQKPIKSIEPYPYSESSSLTWRWLYPGHYILSYEQSLDSASVYQIWDTVQNRLLFTTNDTLPFAMSANGLIATLTPQHTVQVIDSLALPTEYDAKTITLFQTVVTTLSSPSFAHLLALSWSADGSRLATASSDGTIQIWSQSFALNSGQLIQTLHVSSSLNSIALSPDMRYLAVDTSTNAGPPSIQVWDIQSGRLAQSFNGSVFPEITNMEWMNDSHTMLLSSFNQLVLWNTITGRTTMSELQGLTYLPGLEMRPPLSLNQNLLALPLGYSISLIDTPTGKLLRRLQGNENKDYFVSLSLAPDNRHLAALDIYGQIQVWNVQSGREETAYRLPGSFSQKSVHTTNQGWLMSDTGEITWSPDGSMLAATYQGGVVVLGMPHLS